MMLGLYGKLPAKRDFIAVSATPAFLSVWEPWIQGGLSAGTMRLGEAWKTAFLRAPIWRFWLGADLCGETVMGAVMPSLDGVGRYFPLTLFARSDADPSFAPPEKAPQDAWFDRVEALMLSTLDDDATFERTLTDLAALPAPASAAEDSPVRRLTDGTLLAPAASAAFPGAFAAARRADPARAAAPMSFWWTTGGEDFPPTTLSARGMPNPFTLIEMITGTFQPSLPGA